MNWKEQNNKHTFLYIWWFFIDGLTFCFVMQVSSDLSIVDLDVPFSFMFSVSASLNAYSNLGVLAVVTWQVLFISVPMIVFAIRLQVFFLRLCWSINVIAHIQLMCFAAIFRQKGETINSIY
jgi:hypothetical protein